MVKRIVAGALQGEQRPLLTLVEVLRRTGKLEEASPDNLLPDDYEAILASYVAKQKLD